MLGVIWWMYGGYAWLTNAVAPTAPSRRLLLLGGMASYLVLALAIPHAFAGSGTAFGLAYLAIVARARDALHALVIGDRSCAAIVALAPVQPRRRGAARAGRRRSRAARRSTCSGARRAAASGSRRSSSSHRAASRSAPAHFVERHGLVVLIAIGESVVAVGIGAERAADRPRLVVVAVLGLALSACLWWAYFGGDDAAGRARAARRRRPSAAGPGAQRVRLLPPR